MVESARGVQQGCNLGPLCYSAGSLKILKEFRANPPVPGARAVSLVDDITVILPPELSHDMAAIGKVTEWLQERLGVEGISLNRRKSQALLADGVGPEQLTEQQRVAMVRFRGAREKGAMAFVECPGVSQEDTMEGPMWRETLGRSLGSHGAAELVGGIHHGNGCRQETTRLHAISCTKTGWSSLTHNRVLHQALARSLR